MSRLLSLAATALLAVVAGPASAQVPTPAQPVAQPVVPAQAAPQPMAGTAADPAWQAFLATLPPSAAASATPPVVAANPAPAAFAVPAPVPAVAPLTQPLAADGPLTARAPGPVGIPSAGPGKASGVAGVAFLALLGFLAVPRTRRLLLERLGRAPAQAEDAAVDITIRGSQTVGPGQRVVALDVDGQRLLVGMSPGRMDLLHTWFDGVGPGVVPDGADLADLRMDTSAGEKRRASAVIDSILGEREKKPAKGSAALLEAWRRVEALEVDEPADLDEPRELPWFLEGASEDEVAAWEDVEAENDELEAARALERAAASRRARELALRKAAATRKARERRAAAPEPKKATGTDGWKGAARFVLLLLVGFVVAACVPDVAMAQDVAPALKLEVAGAGAGGSDALRLLATLTLMAVAPALILAMTSFTRIIVVFSLLRQAIGVQQAPPNQVLIGLALFLTWFVMGPTFDRVQEDAVTPWMAGEITEGEALGVAMVPMRSFMFRNTREKDLALFLSLDRSPRPATREEVPARVLVPAFVISELKTAFQIGFLLYIPFLVIDIVVATVLLAMGMMVLPPVVISLPFKLLLFVFVDGWNLLIGSLVGSFG